MERIFKSGCMLMLVFLFVLTVGNWSHQDKAYAG